MGNAFYTLTIPTSLSTIKLSNTQSRLNLCGCCNPRSIPLNATTNIPISWPALHNYQQYNDYYAVKGYTYVDSNNTQQILQNFYNGSDNPNISNFTHISSIDNANKLYFNTDTGPNIFSHTTTTLWPVIANSRQNRIIDSGRGGDDHYPSIPTYTIGSVALHPNLNYMYTIPLYWRNGYLAMTNFMNTIFTFGNTGTVIDDGKSRSLLRQAIGHLDTYATSVCSVLYMFQSTSYPQTNNLHDDMYFWIALHNWCIPNSDISLVPNVADELQTVYVSPMATKTYPTGNMDNSNNNKGVWMGGGLPKIGTTIDKNHNTHTTYGFMPEYYYPYVRNGDQSWYNLYLDGGQEIFFLANTDNSNIRILQAIRGTDLMATLTPFNQNQDNLNNNDKRATQSYDSTGIPTYNQVRDQNNDTNGNIYNILPVSQSSIVYKAQNDIRDITGITDFNSIFGATWSSFGGSFLGTNIQKATAEYQGGIFSRLYADRNQSPNIYFCYSPHLYPGQICIFIIQEGRNGLDGNDVSTWNLKSTGNFTTSSYIDNNDRTFIGIRCGLESMVDTWKSLLSTQSTQTYNLTPYLTFGTSKAATDTVLAFDPRDGSKVQPYTLTYLSQGSSGSPSFFNSDLQMYYKQYTIARDYKLGQTFKAFLAHRYTDLSSFGVVASILTPGLRVGAFPDVLKTLTLPRYPIDTDGIGVNTPMVPNFSHYNNIQALKGHGYVTPPTISNAAGFSKGNPTVITITTASGLVSYNAPNPEISVPIVIYFDHSNPLLTWVSWSELLKLYNILQDQVTNFSKYVGGVSTTATGASTYKIDFSDFTTAYKLLACFGYGIYANSITIGVITDSGTSLVPNGPNFASTGTFINSLSASDYNTSNTFEVSSTKPYSLVDIADYIQLPTAAKYHNPTSVAPVIPPVNPTPGNANDGTQTKKVKSWVIILIASVIGGIIVVLLIIGIAISRSKELDPNMYNTRKDLLS